MKRLLVCLGICAALAVVGFIGFVGGAIIGQLQLYQSLTDQKLMRIRPVLAEPRFAGVAADYSSAAQVYLTGTVGSEEALKDLEGRMRFLFGDEEARFMLATVDVSQAPTTPSLQRPRPAPSPDGPIDDPADGPVR